MAYPEVQSRYTRWLYIRQMHFLHAGDQEPKHTHSFDHYTHLSRGKARLLIDGVEHEFTAPQLIFIRANTEHEVTALEDDTVACCIHQASDFPTPK